MLKYFSKVTYPGPEVKINPKMLKYLNEYTENQICNKNKYFALLRCSGSGSDDPDKNNIKLVVFVGIISFLAGSYFHFVVS
jgi:hypothetical protein